VGTVHHRPTQLLISVYDLFVCFTAKGTQINTRLQVSEILIFAAQVDGSIFSRVSD
jgi:hypothetical protein